MKAPFTPGEIQAVLFDLDGTLMDTDDATVALWERFFARLRMRRERASALARRLVMALETPMNFSATVLDLFGLDTVFVRLFSAAQNQRGKGIHPPVEGAALLLRALATQYQLAIVSTRTTLESQAFLATLNVDGRIAVIAGRDSTWRIKPHPQPILWAAEQLGVPAERCLMVGDTTVDMRSARRAGAWAAGVLCGFGERPELERAGAHIILDHTHELSALLT